MYIFTGSTLLPPLSLTHRLDLYAEWMCTYTLSIEQHRWNIKYSDVLFGYLVQLTTIMKNVVYILAEVAVPNGWMCVSCIRVTCKSQWKCGGNETTWNSMMGKCYALVHLYLWNRGTETGTRTGEQMMWEFDAGGLPFQASWYALTQQRLVSPREISNSLNFI